MRRRGFTLIEVMVALGVFALVSITVYARIHEVLTGARELEDRTFGTWLARDALTRMRLDQRHSDGAAIPLGQDRVRVRMAGRDWQIRTEVRATSDRILRRVEIEVRADPGQGADADAPVAARLVGFVGLP